MFDLIASIEWLFPGHCLGLYIRNFFTFNLVIGRTFRQEFGGVCLGTNLNQSPCWACEGAQMGASTWPIAVPFGRPGLLCGSLSLIIFPMVWFSMFFSRFVKIMWFGVGLMLFGRSESCGLVYELVMPMHFVHNKFERNCNTNEYLKAFLFIFYFYLGIDLKAMAGPLT